MRQRAAQAGPVGVMGERHALDREAARFEEARTEQAQRIVDGHHG
ncbi:hypothetical protein [Thiobacillus sp.]|nr:hypothetical protein [Thiobacillus sp.]